MQNVTSYLNSGFNKTRDILGKFTGVVEVLVQILKTSEKLTKGLKDTNAKITKLAQGLPVGGEIESLDDGTLLSAFKNRSKLNSNSS